MSEENVISFIEATDAFNRMGEKVEANLDDLQTFLRNMDPEVRFEPVQAAIEGGYVGHEGVIRWLGDLAQEFVGGHMEFSDVRDLDDRVLALGTLRTKGRSSRVETEVPVAILARYENGLLTHLKDYGDTRKALEAAGLSE
jgi:SnoaL-like protein